MKITLTNDELDSVGHFTGCGCCEGLGASCDQLPTELKKAVESIIAARLNDGNSGAVV